MLAARIILVVAVLNLVLLLSALAMNVARVYLGWAGVLHASAHDFLVRKYESGTGDSLYRIRHRDHCLLHLGRLPRALVTARNNAFR
jgi:hypothetical protein